MGQNWHWSYKQGRIKRLAAERDFLESGIAVPKNPSLHSHDGTMQSKFDLGWFSVTWIDIQEATNTASSFANAKARLKQCSRGKA